MNKASTNKLLPTGMLLLSVIGVILMGLSQTWSIYYWFFCFAVIGLMFMWGAKKGEGDAHLSQHLVHWLGSLLGLSMILLFVQNGRLDSTQGGLVTIVLLGFSVFSDGLRIHYRYAVVGLFLFATAALVSFIESYIWWFALLAILVIIFEIWWIKSKSSQETESMPQHTHNHTSHQNSHQTSQD